MSEATRVNGGKRKPPKEGGSNARERARVAAAEAARRRKRRNLGLLVLAIVVVVAAVGIGIGYATNFGRPKANTASNIGWGPVSVTPGKPIVLGQKDAKTTVKLYEDFRCPHCQEFETKFGETLNGLQKNGTMKIELWILPVIDAEDNSDHSLRAGNAFACAAEEGFGQAMYQAFWKNPGKAWTDEMLIDLGNQVADPPSSFKSCVTGLKHKDWVDSAQPAASADQVTGTPTMFINGKMQSLGTVMEWTPQQMTDAIKRG
ncbi:thioredoxin domain-containing protein [Microlunatus sp. Gsoil 973]|jgi:protein-disulfide isomerase|uniref:DsbA family protein n=1 Tax=Microlunatus sp. Gsoil 973 TaxID=2672569 RepID=UPI0012B45F87|nr:thioredoxin domain-containing protein [Microlunatus sp. Gsoil 973]QGN32382.1 thioredoxin domain-containing protein [Microlunatus sp. Gsoil 973]